MVYNLYMEEKTVLDVLEMLPIATIMWVVLGIVVVVFMIFSSILFWHWRMYSTGKFTTISNMVMYLTVSALFIVLMTASIITYSVL